MSQRSFVAMLALASSAPAFAQWEQATGTAGLNMQSLLSRNGFAYAGGATGAYRSADGERPGETFGPSGRPAAEPGDPVVKTPRHRGTCRPDPPVENPA